MALGLTWRQFVFVAGSFEGVKVREGAVGKPSPRRRCALGRDRTGGTGEAAGSPRARSAAPPACCSHHPPQQHPTGSQEVSPRESGRCDPTRPDPTRRFPALESRDAKGEAADKAKQPGRLQKGETRRRGPGSLPSWRPGGPFPGGDDRDSPQW